MEILFLHQNFPAQFLHLARALGTRHRVRAWVPQGRAAPAVPGVELLSYPLERGSTPGVHPWLGSLESQVIRGQGVLGLARELERREGYRPDLVLAHPGWGEALFIQELWPQVPLGLYCEYYYRPEGGDVGFDPEFPRDPIESACQLRLRNGGLDLQLARATGGLAPTSWQADGFPAAFRQRIRVVHDGVPTRLLCPAPDTVLELGDGLVLGRQDEVITFVARNLEPLRGFHVLLRALPRLLAERPRARVLIVGAEANGYGSPSPDGRSWKEIFLAEVSPRLTPAQFRRIHFLGQLPYAQFLGVLRVSSVHVYLSYPFVLSWSLLEAMSLGCAIVGSDTAPVREVLAHEVTGLLVDFFDQEGLVAAICRLLEDPALRQELGVRARARVVAEYDLDEVCLPRQLAWAQSLV